VAVWRLRSSSSLVAVLARTFSALLSCWLGGKDMLSSTIDYLVIDGSDGLITSNLLRPNALVVRLALDDAKNCYLRVIQPRR
jgi:hypothetical protein